MPAERWLERKNETLISEERIASVQIWDVWPNSLRQVMLGCWQRHPENSQNDGQT